MRDGLMILIAVLSGVIGLWLWLWWNGCPSDDGPSDDALRCLFSRCTDAGERAIENAEEMDRDD